MRGRDDRHLERHAGAVEHAGEHVAAELVDAERMRPLDGPVGVPNESSALGSGVFGAGDADELDDQRREDRAPARAAR